MTSVENTAGTINWSPRASHVGFSAPSARTRDPLSRARLAACRGASLIEQEPDGAPDDRAEARPKHTGAQHREGAHEPAGAVPAAPRAGDHPTRRPEEGTCDAAYKGRVAAVPACCPAAGFRLGTEGRPSRANSACRHRDEGLGSERRRRNQERHGDEGGGAEATEGSRHAPRIAWPRDGADTSADVAARRLVGANACS